MLSFTTSDSAQKAGSELTAVVLKLCGGIDATPVNRSGSSSLSLRLCRMIVQSSLDYPPRAISHQSIKMGFYNSMTRFTASFDYPSPSICHQNLSGPDGGG